MKKFFALAISPIKGIYNGCGSMLSDSPLSKSIKRGISAAFAIGVLYMVWFFLNKKVPVENQATFRHCFDVLVAAIVLLTGAATIKDIIALKNGTKETTIVNTPAATVSQVTETPNNANTDNS